MNVFISYASEYRPVAEKLAVGLVQDGHETFFDRDQLPAGDGFHTQIREAIAAADLVVFLLSPEAIESSSYALTELNLVKERWPNPSQRVLPVLVKKTPYEAVPAYLGAITIFEPRGNVVADVLAEIAKIDRRRKRRRVLVVGSAAVAAAAAAVIVAVNLLNGTPVVPATVILGSVTDALTGAVVAGASAEVATGADVIGSGESGTDGRFSVSINVPNTAEAQNLKMTVRHDGHADAASDVVIVSGRPDNASYTIELLPSALAACRHGSNHLVVVGYFRPPSGQADDPQLAARVTDTLYYNLLQPMQRESLELLPAILECGKVQPQSATDYPGYAKALKADAFVGGYVTAAASSANTKVKVQMVIADRYGLLEPPALVSSPDVDLNDPAAAQLSPDAYVAILTALVAGYEKAGESAECVKVGNVAEQVIGTLPALLAEVRERCRHSLPNHELLRSSP